jgi:23S rRNA (adenine2503-C2)-methyltransferase
VTELRIAGPLPAISETKPETLAAWLEARGEPAYRAQQVLAGAHRPDASGFADLSDLPAALRGQLAASFRFSTIAASHVLEADNGLTAKAVHELADGQRIESVLMRTPARGASAARTTICISSQAGCAVNCPFCATGQAGFGRQLTPGEIVDQVLHWHRAPWQALGVDWRPGSATGHYNIVFMGMGEPLNNRQRVFAAVRLLNDPDRLAIGARHITVSTSGVVPAIDLMIDELPQVNLAISLHAADDRLRDELVPINRKWPVREVIDAGRRFAEQTGRRVSLEYVMIDGVNDSLVLAERLTERARGWLSHVNLIPLNPTPGSRWSGTPLDRVHAFAGVLRAAGVPVTIRDTRGREIEAACGQLHAQLAGRDLRALAATTASATTAVSAATTASATTAASATSKGS